MRKPNWQKHLNLESAVLGYVEHRTRWDPEAREMVTESGVRVLADARLPLKSAAASAALFREAFPRTPDELLQSSLREDLLRLGRTGRASRELRAQLGKEELATVRAAAAAAARTVDLAAEREVALAAQREAAAAAAKAAAAAPLLDLYKRCGFRTAKCGHETVVDFDVAADDAHVRSNMVSCGRYKGSYSGFAKRTSEHVIRAAVAWHRTVLSFGLGLFFSSHLELPLSAVVCGVHRDRPVFRVRCAAQGPGTMLKTVQRAVALTGDRPGQFELLTSDRGLQPLAGPPVELVDLDAVERVRPQLSVAAVALLWGAAYAATLREFKLA